MPRKIHDSAELAAYKTGLLKPPGFENEKDKYIRLAAEFDNYKKRTARQFSELIRTANEELIVEILAILDDFQRALESIAGESETSSTEGHEGIVTGMKLIYEKLSSALQRRGLQLMDALDKPFDPVYHEAVMQSASDREEGTVIGIVSPGYLLNGKVIRHARVIVAAPPD